MHERWVAAAALLIALAAAAGHAQAPRAGGGDAASSGETPDPSAVREDVMGRLEESGRVDPSGVEVTTVSGRAIRLTGTVGSVAEKRYASAVAAQSELVNFIYNDLEVAAD